AFHRRAAGEALAALQPPVLGPHATRTCPGSTIAPAPSTRVAATGGRSEWPVRGSAWRCVVERRRRSTVVVGHLPLRCRLVACGEVGRDGRRLGQLGGGAQRAEGGVPEGPLA